VLDIRFIGSLSPEDSLMWRDRDFYPNTQNVFKTAPDPTGQPWVQDVNSVSIAEFVEKLSFI
jgi:hypothetical protein